MIYNVNASNVTHFFISYILHKYVVAFLRPISARLPVFTLIYSTGAVLWPETYRAVYYLTYFLLHWCRKSLAILLLTSCKIDNAKHKTSPNKAVAYFRVVSEVIWILQQSLCCNHKSTSLNVKCLRWSGTLFFLIFSSQFLITLKKN